MAQGSVIACLYGGRRIKKTPRIRKDGCPAEEKHFTIQALSKKVNPDTNQVYGISFMCQYVGISRAVYYKLVSP